MRRIRTVIGVIGVTCVLASFAAAQPGPTVKSEIESRGLPGIFALDCSQPASRNNRYLVFRVDGDHGRRDVMVSQEQRLDASVIDRATALQEDRLDISFTNKKRRMDQTLVVEAKRLRVLESGFEGGRKTIAAGRIVKSGRQARWFDRCG